eukprot:471734-Pleurochrysis_carterae.AAC.7
MVNSCTQLAQLHARTYNASCCGTDLNANAHRGANAHRSQLTGARERMQTLMCETDPPARAHTHTRNISGQIARPRARTSNATLRQ